MTGSVRNANTTTRLLRFLLLLVAVIRLDTIDAFGVVLPRAPRSHTELYSGTGIAKGYKWQEEAFEIDVTVKVPQETRAKNVQFKATTRSIDLKVTLPNGEVQTLLDGSRALKGRVSLDGTFWVISDVTQDEDMMNLASPYREITVTVEKMIRTPKDDFEVVEYDWKGLYLEEMEQEVSYRKYDGPEELDVREYAAGMGVDIDNLNMSMVDKTMFSSGLNLTQSSMDELTKAGLISEVTQQLDGSEFVVNPETGEQEPLSDLAKGAQQPKQDAKQIPFLDTNSPWHNAIPVNETSQLDPAQFGLTEDDDEDEEEEEDDESGPESDVVQQKRYFTRAAFAKDAAKPATDDQAKKLQQQKLKNASDPIDMLTVKKLKEVLKSQGLKVSGNKKELQDRLRRQVNSLLQQGNTGDGSDKIENQNH